MNFVAFLLFHNVFLRLATRNVALTLIYIKAIHLRQQALSLYFRTIKAKNLTAKSMTTFIGRQTQLILPLKQASDFLGLGLYVSVVTNFPGNALVVVGALILKVSLSVRILVITMAIFQVAFNTLLLSWAASVGPEVQRPSMHSLSAFIRSQIKISPNGFDLHFFLRFERHCALFLGRPNKHGLAFGSLGLIPYTVLGKVFVLLPNYLL